MPGTCKFERDFFYFEDPGAIALLFENPGAVALLFENPGAVALL